MPELLASRPLNPVGIRRCLALLLAAFLLLGPAPGASAAWVTLDGEKVIEINSAAGAQTPEEVAERISSHLTRMVRNPRFEANQVVVREEPPYSMVGLLNFEGKFIPGLAVDERAAKQAGTTREALAKRYRDAVRSAIVAYEDRNRLRNWIVGTLLALAVLVVYVLWLRWQRRTHVRLKRWLAGRSVELAPKLKIGQQTLVTSAQTRAISHLALSIVHWGLLITVSWLLIPLLLSFFPPTQAMADGLSDQILSLALRLIRACLRLVPSLLWIAVIAVGTALMVRVSNWLFAALRRGQISIR
ncbi:MULTISPECIES: hypothetical protein [Aphanothece]|uniref:hypothetical protein n=1 Tax=Aphanothece TaxID=1121 RepID=UPI00398EE2A9